jgi:hypothetical protein
MRFQNVAELSAALAPYALSTAQAAIAVERTSRVLGTEPPKSTSMLTSTSTTVPPTTGRRWAVFAAGGVVAIAAIAIIAVVGSHGRTDAVGTGQPAIPDAAIATSSSPDAAVATLRPSPDAAIAAVSVDAAVAPGDAAVAASSTVDAAVVVTTTPKPPKPPKPSDGKPPKPGDGKPPKPPPSNAGSDDVLGTRQ